MANIKTQFITTLSDLKTLATALGGWFTADKTTDVNFNGTVVPSRAKELDSIKQSLSNTKDYAKKDLSNVDLTDYLPRLPIKIFTQTSGKFFVRNADGTLPNGITLSKVWTLADQATSNSGIAPSGKTHVELPVGLANFTLAGAGGGGGSYGGNGGDGGSVSCIHRTAKGGIGGYKSGNPESKVVQLMVGGVGIGTTIMAGGASGGIHHFGDSGSATSNSGGNGGLIKFTDRLSYGQVETFTIGVGGSGAVGGDAYYNSYGQNGADGYIEVEYV